MDTGKIRDWPEGKTADIQAKPVDEGYYSLLSEEGEELALIEEDYVPDCIPGRHGDYVQFLVDGSGKIAEWERFFTEKNVRDSFFRRV